MYTYLGKQKNVTALSDAQISLIVLINSYLAGQYIKISLDQLINEISAP